ncbi:MAG: ribonuclease H, partial [Spirochaetaceae bacterium]|nr:ribonuclease H [Spirochaetaceae bacterium]
EDNPMELSGGDPSTTNNRMELTAVIEALKLVSLRYGGNTPVEIHTDSQYVQKGIGQWMNGWIAKGWKTAAGKPVKNKDLWLTLRELDTGMDVKWYWVKGHSGNRWNERCDELVAAQRLLF